MPPNFKCDADSWPWIERYTKKMFQFTMGMAEEPTTKAIWIWHIWADFDWVCFHRSLQLEKVCKRKHVLWNRFLESSFCNRIDFSRFFEFVTPVVSADAGTKPNESTVNEDVSDDGSLSEDQQVKKKKNREKVGFRDRKVIACLPNLCELFTIWFLNIFCWFWFFELFMFQFLFIIPLCGTKLPLTFSKKNKNQTLIFMRLDHWVWKSYACIFNAR